VTRVVPDLEIGFLQKQCTKGLDIVQLRADSVCGHLHLTWFVLTRGGSGLTPVRRDDVVIFLQHLAGYRQPQL